MFRSFSPPAEHGPAGRTRPRHPPRRQHRQRLHLGRLEDRVTPSLLGTFELDANATTGVLGTSGSTTTSHDRDQVFADSQAVPPTTTSGALAFSFVTDKVNTTADNIF